MNKRITTIGVVLLLSLVLSMNTATADVWNGIPETEPEPGFFLPEGFVIPGGVIGPGGYTIPAGYVILDNPEPEPESNSDGGTIIPYEPGCNDLWWYDDTSTECLLDTWCGVYMYETLRTFEGYEECECSLYSDYPGLIPDPEPLPSLVPTPTPVPLPESNPIPTPVPLPEPNVIPTPVPLPEPNPIPTPRPLPDWFVLSIASEPEPISSRGTMSVELWWYDETSIACQLDVFYSPWEYEEFNVFETLEECEVSFCTEPEPPGKKTFYDATKDKWKMFLKNVR